MAVGPAGATAVAVLYATREGHTGEIARHVAAKLESRGFAVAIHDLRESGEPLDLLAVGGVVLAASVHRGRYEAEALDFVRRHREALRRVPSAFLSVTLSQAGVQRGNASAEEHAKFVADVDRMTERFVAESGWRPTRIVPVAGALRYSRYNPLTRWVMKRIARAAGGSTDTSRDHDYTDWTALDRFVEAFASDFAGGTIR